MIADQVKYFDKEKFELHLVTLFQDESRESLYYLLPKDIEAHALRFKSFRDLWAWADLIKVIYKIKPDVVLSSLFFSNTVFRVLKILFGYRVITIEQNTYTDKTKVKILVDKMLSYITYRIVAVSKAVADFTAKQGKISRSKFLVIFNCINLEEINTFKKQYDKVSLRKELGFRVDDRVVINVARLVKQKNHDLLIHSFHEFCKKKNNYKLLILGGGSLEGELNQLIKDLGVEDRVFMMGLRRDVYKYYILSDFFISTSHIEGLSVAYLEAMAFGLPLLVTKTGGTDDIIVEGRNGYFIEEETVEDVVSGLIKMSNVDLQRMGSEASEVAKNYSIQENVRRYEELFSSCYSD